MDMVPFSGLTVTYNIHNLTYPASSSGQLLISRRRHPRSPQSWNTTGDSTVRD